LADAVREIPGALGPLEALLDLPDGPPRAAVVFAHPLPTAGGTIETLLDGTQPHQMLDNITVTRRGQVVALEDVGNNAHIGKVWRYSIAGNTLNPVAEHDPLRFASGAPNFLTQDEETSGIIDVSDILGEGWFLLDVQAHYSISGELVEGGQLLALHYPPGTK